MGTPTRFTYGIATTAKTTPLGSYPLPDPFHTGANQGLDVVSYSNDFFTVGSTTLDWTITGVSSTFAITDGVGGVALVTPGAATTTTTVAGAHNGFGLVAGQEFWYVARVKPSAVAGTVAFTFGLQNGTSATPTDGLYFQKPASSTSVNLVSRVGSTSTTLVTGVATAVAGEYLDLAYTYDGTDLLVYASDKLVARVASPTFGTSGTTLTTALLTPSFQIVPGGTLADTLSIDYVLAAQETLR